MRYQHWFWDFDGTLYDTYPRVVRAFQKAMGDFGLSADEEEMLLQVKKTLGVAARWAANGDPSLTDELIARYMDYAEMEGAESMRPYEGVGKILSAIVERGGKNYLYTHRDMTGVEALRRDGLWVYFTDKVTAEDGFPYKPAPDALQSLIQKHRLDPQSCCMVGDRSIDLDAGKNAGMVEVLFDPDGFYDGYPTSNRFDCYASMQKALVEETS